MTDVKKWLTEEEWEIYNAWKANPAYLRASDYMAPELKHLEALAAERELSEARRALLKKHQHIGTREMAKEFKRCISCGREKYKDCTPDCAIATVLQGVGE